MGKISVQYRSKFNGAGKILGCERYFPVKIVHSRFRFVQEIWI